MADYADMNDVIMLFRPLDHDEAKRAAALIPVVCATLRGEARRRGYDLSDMLAKDEDLRVIAKSVTVDVVARCLMTPTAGPPMTQYSEAAGGYSVSGSFLNPGGGVFIKNAELSRLGIRRQKMGVVDLYDNPWNSCDPE